MIRLFLIIALLTAIGWPSHAGAQVKRCVAADGTSIYTDRRCEDIGAVDQLPRHGAAGATRAYRGGCARTLQDLVFEMTSAIDSKDVNRLAGVVHWVGVPTRSAYQRMSRLGTIVNRPLVDVITVSPRMPDELDGDYYPQAATRRTPVALRIEQTLANGITPSRTVFGLQRHVGCWWLRM